MHKQRQQPLHTPQQTVQHLELEEVLDVALVLLENVTTAQQ